MTPARFSASFAKMLRKARLARGLSQEALAEAAQVHPTYVSRVETTKINPTIAVCYRFARALGKPLSVLVGAAEKAARFHRE
jgi:transcriptional regulator with XRE-family HTH domain